MVVVLFRLLRMVLSFVMFGGYCVLILMFFMIGGEVVYLLKWVIVVFVFGGYLVE